MKKQWKKRITAGILSGVLALGSVFGTSSGMIGNLLDVKAVSADPIRLDGGDSIAEAVSTVSDQVYVDDISEIGEADWFSFTTPDYECYTATKVYNSTINTGWYEDQRFYMSIRTSEDVEKGYCTVSKGSDYTLYRRLTPNTKYYLKFFNAWNKTGQYQFNYSFVADPDRDSLDEATDISLNKAYDKTLAAPQDEDYFKFVAPVSGAYSFYLRNRNIESEISLTVYNKYKESLLVVKSEKQTEDTQPVELEAGTTYYIGCSNVDLVHEGDTGDYAIKVLPPEDALKKNLGQCTISLEYSKVDYTGAAFTPKVTVKDGDNLLVEGTNYEVKYQNNINAGTATVVVTGIGIYEGTVNKNFTIVKKEEPTTTEPVTDPAEEPTTYPAEEPTTHPAEEPTAKKEYKVTFMDGEEIVGIQSVTEGSSAVAPNITKDGYRLSWDRSFTNVNEDLIVNAVWSIIEAEKADISSAKITVEEYEVENNGKVQMPVIKSVVLGNTILQEGVDYKCRKMVCEPIDVGIYGVTIEIDGIGNYTGTASLNYMITAPTTPTSKSTQKLSYAKKIAKAYGSKAFSVGAKLVTGDGKLSYVSSDKKVATVSSSGKVTIKGTGTCTITVKASETDSYKAQTGKITLTVVPKKATLKSAKAAGKGKINIKWNRDKTVTGYEIQYSTSSSFKKASTITMDVAKNSTVSANTNYGIKRGKTYYVRIRSYKKVKGNRLFGAWSKVVKSNKIK